MYVQERTHIQPRVRGKSNIKADSLSVQVYLLRWITGARKAHQAFESPNSKLYNTNFQSVASVIISRQNLYIPNEKSINGAPTRQYWQLLSTTDCQYWISTGCSYLKKSEMSLKLLLTFLID